MLKPVHIRKWKRRSHRNGTRQQNQAVSSHKQELHSSFMKVNAVNPSLVDRLKQVKVDDSAHVHDSVHHEKSEAEKMKLPVERFGFSFPYVFNKPESVPLGKIAVLDLLEMMITVQKEKLAPQDLVTMYSLELEDAENIIKYVEIFVAAKEDRTGIELYRQDADGDIYVQRRQEALPESFVEAGALIKERWQGLIDAEEREKAWKEKNKEFSEKFHKETGRTLKKKKTEDSFRSLKR